MNTTPPCRDPGTTMATYSLIMLCLIYAISFLDRNILYVLAPSIQHDLRLSDTQLGMLSGLAFALFYATFALPIAHVAERRSRVALISIALAVWSTMTALCGAANGFLQLFLARLGVGVGEGACSPAAQSMICDLFPPERRATALSIYAMGVPIGVLLGSIGGAWAAQIFGWRMAFVLAAVPGLVAAVVFRLTVREPRRGSHEIAAYVDRDAPSFMEIVRTLWSSSSFRQLGLGYAISAVPGTSALIFLPVLLVRAFGATPLQAGIAYGVIGGVTGAIGMVVGGRLTDHYASRTLRAYGLVPAVAFVITAPLLIIALCQHSALIFALAMTGPGTLYVFNVGSSYAVTNNLVAPRERATANAILLLIITIFGAGLGPVLVGWLSDLIAQRSFGASYVVNCLHRSVIAHEVQERCGAAGVAGLRSSLMIVALFYLWAAFHYLRLAQALPRELAPPPRSAALQALRIGTIETFD